jgi:hypothetical protein
LPFWISFHHFIKLLFKILIAINESLYFEKALLQDKQRASHVLQEIKKLYAIERKKAGPTPEERHATRLEEALPLINDLGKWMQRERNMVLPKSLIGKAIEYCTKLWLNLLAYLNNGNYHIDNNAKENKIQPVAIGRKITCLPDHITVQKEQPCSIPSSQTANLTA